MWPLSKKRPNEQWFENLVHGHIDELTAFAFRLCGNREQAEDLVQETFTEAWNGIGSVKKIDSSRAWLFRVLRRRYARLIRSKVARPELLQVDEESQDFWSTVPSTTPTPHQLAASKDYLEKLLATLDERFRTPLLMATMEGLTIAEIAEELSLPTGTVLSRIHRGRQHLQTAASALEQPHTEAIPHVIEMNAIAQERKHHGS